MTAVEFLTAAAFMTIGAVGAIEIARQRLEGSRFGAAFLPSVRPVYLPCAVHIRPLRRN